ncbi:flagellar motor switch protein FliG [Laribacter hongkongensis]|jgi:flagellar motor switch protein FliG|uniref:Flagellar motor switch protein FliG n=1 Tax=Laribacter hongkongensis TaxID=168471 RepID=A0A248LLB0_9NEIS|nr:flagellar motor switch protein FliG [Laribacter hongkongensis]ASJ25261.1 flagellar motor switch protein FliG [Laribacter hongkongensis]MBE5527893.1 flagellar motor switch protein FliG [Laribacter hongkongensis]MCG8992884.1 flagellar motor switch protein FliG [Laribacter hongkongensis]MCG8997137.1 flagellar motor switch protein FliG [Laribacter hongkongensis]MCG9002278.1 flagellar motor switch protein FliG [Laribacter hongkongensis]
MSDAGIRRSAVLLFSLGQADAVEVFKYLGPKEVQKISTMMTQITNLGRDEIMQAAQLFRDEAQMRASIDASDEFLKRVLTEALGEDKASNLLDKITQGNDHTGIESLKWMDPASAADLIRNEHPQIIATILVHLDPDQSSAILQNFTDRLRNDALLRIATLEGVQPQALRELNDVLTQLLSGSDRIKKSAMGGIQLTAEILNFMGANVEHSALGSIREYDPELAQRIQDKMFVFENLRDLDNRSIQVLLREVSSESLILALKGTSNELKEKIFKNMSSRAAEMLRDDFEAKGPVKVSEVEAEQKEILKIVRKLADDGQIVMAGKGGEEGVVE